MKYQMPKKISRWYTYWQRRRRNGNLFYRVLSIPARWLAENTRKYIPYTPEERAKVRQEVYSYSGNKPKLIGGELPVRYSEAFEYAPRREFKNPRPLTEKVDNLVYTPRGRGWVKGRLYEKYSIDPQPHLADLIPPLGNIERIAQGSILQVEHPYTYGDWFAEVMVTLVHAQPNIEPPLLLPKNLLEKPYALRDLRKLNIEVRAVEKPVLVQEAVVIHKMHPRLEIGLNDVVAYRKTFAINPVTPKPGSILYLSRQGIKSERFNRTLQSEIIAQILAELGATIVLTGETGPEEYMDLASQAETVIADHGAAMYNLIYWKTQNLIELFSNDWWSSCFLSFGKALGIENYSLVCVDNLDYDTLRSRLMFEIDNLRALNSVSC